MGIVGAATDQVGLGFDLGDARAHSTQRDDAFDLGHDFRADAVTGKKQEFVSGHGLAPTLC